MSGLPDYLKGIIGKNAAEKAITSTLMLGIALECANSFSCGSRRDPLFDTNVLNKCIELVTAKVPLLKQGGAIGECEAECKKKIEEKCKSDPVSCSGSGSPAG